MSSVEIRSSLPYGVLTYPAEGFRGKTQIRSDHIDWKTLDKLWVAGR